MSGTSFVRVGMEVVVQGEDWRREVLVLDYLGGLMEGGEVEVGEAWRAWIGSGEGRNPSRLSRPTKMSTEKRSPQKRAFIKIKGK